MEFKVVEEDLNSELKKDFRAQRDGFVQVGEQKWFYPKKFIALAEELKNFEVRCDDIWITGHPRSGTTLTEEILWLMSHNFDYDQAKKIPICLRVTFFELNIVVHDEIEKEQIQKFPEERIRSEERRNNLNALNQHDRNDRRVIKTHLPFELLPEDVLKKGCKVIYVCRQPKDVCVSFYLLQSRNKFMDFGGGFQKYWKYFKDGHCPFGPYFEHVKQAFDRIGSKNFEFVFYEEFRENVEKYIDKLSKLLDISISEQQSNELKQYIDIENFRKVTDVKIRDKNNKQIEFVRTGRVNGWKDYFTDEMNEEAEEWIKTNTERIGIKYPQKPDEC